MRTFLVWLASGLLWLGDANAAEKRVDACAVLTQAEIQALIARSAMKGQKSDVAELSSCTYGNPQAPVLNGMPTDVLVKIDVFHGERPGQAREVQEIARKNAAEVQPVSGLGDQAYWDGILRTLWVVKGNRGVNVSVGSDLGGLKTARAIADKVLAKLP
jgi:hypothetical protein